MDASGTLISRERLPDTHLSEPLHDLAVHDGQLYIGDSYRNSLRVVDAGTWQQKEEWFLTPSDIPDVVHLNGVGVSSDGELFYTAFLDHRSLPAERHRDMWATYIAQGVLGRVSSTGWCPGYHGLWQPHTPRPWNNALIVCNSLGREVLAFGRHWHCIKRYPMDPALYPRGLALSLIHI